MNIKTTLLKVLLQNIVSINLCIMKRQMTSMRWFRACSLNRNILVQSRTIEPAKGDLSIPLLGGVGVGTVKRIHTTEF